jgi:transmembrane sensor
MNGADPADADGWRVSAGYQISYDASTNAARIAAVDAQRMLAWREGRLEYFSEPLGSVVADVSRYSARPIEIGDPQLANLTFTGTVFTASIDDWLGAVESSFPVRVVTTRDNHVLLLLRAPAEPSDGNH